MAKPSQEAAVRLRQDLRIGKCLVQSLDCGLELGLLGLEPRIEEFRASGDAHRQNRRDRAFEHDRNGANDQEPDADPTQVSHSLASPSSIPATGAIATTWSSGERRITITPCVCRPIWEIAPTWVRSTMPLALITSTSSSGSLTTRTATSLPTRSVTFSVKTPCPAR